MGENLASNISQGLYFAVNDDGVGFTLECFQIVKHLGVIEISILNAGS